MAGSFLTVSLRRERDDVWIILNLTTSTPPKKNSRTSTSYFKTLNGPLTKHGKQRVTQKNTPHRGRAEATMLPKQQHSRAYTIRRSVYPPPPSPHNQAGSFPAPSTTLIGVSVSGGVMKHGAGYRSVPWDPGEEESATGGTGGVLDDRVEGARWYKARHLNYGVSCVCRSRADLCRSRRPRRFVFIIPLPPKCNGYEAS